MMDMMFIMFAFFTFYLRCKLVDHRTAWVALKGMSILIEWIGLALNIHMKHIKKSAGVIYSLC